MQKIKVNNFISVLKLFLYFTFFIQPFLMSFLYLLICEKKNYFLGGSYLFSYFFIDKGEHFITPGRVTIDNLKFQ